MKGKIRSIVALLAILMLIVTSAPLADTKLAMAASGPASTALCDHDITDMAVASDGKTIYVIDGHDTKAVVYKSTDGGHNFGPCTMPPDFVTPPQAIAVAPDDPNVVVVSDSSANEVVWLSTNGGTTWTNLPALCAGGDTLTDLAISPAIPGTVLGRYFFATVADNDAGTALGDVKEIGGTAAWASVSDNVTGTHDYMAIQVTPNFAGDRCICVVGACVGAALPWVDYQIINTTGAGSVTQTVQFVPAGTTTDFSLPAAGSSIIYADIALPIDFDPTTIAFERAFVGIGSNSVQTTDDVYRVDGPIAFRLHIPPGTGLCIRSIDYAGTIAGGKLIAGEQATTMVWHTTDNGNTWNSSSPPPTGETDAVVGMAPDFATTDTCYAGTSGDNSCFSISIDNAHTFPPCQPERPEITITPTPTPIPTPPPPPPGTEVPWLWIILILLACGGVGYSLKRYLNRPEIKIRPQKDIGTQQIESDTPIQLDFEIRLRPVLDPGKQDVETEGPLIIDERREEHHE